MQRHVGIAALWLTSACALAQTRPMPPQWPGADGGKEPLPPPEALTYNEGGYADWSHARRIAYATEADPAERDGIPSEQRYYVCSAGGSDGNDGHAREAAWATLDKVEAEAGGFSAGTYVLLCRGGRWNDDLRIEGRALGTPESPTVFGAYGDTSDPPPYLQRLDMDGSGGYMVRDLDFERWGTFTRGSRHVTLFNNIVHGGSGVSNCVGAFGEFEYFVMARNLVYDCELNDGVSLHDTGTSQGYGYAPIGRAWVIANYFIGSGSMEDCVDVQGASASNTEDPPSEDFKVVLNRCMGTALDGFSTLGGQAAMCIANNHANHYVWAMWNLCMGTKQRSYNSTSTGLARRGTVISGNVFVSETGGTSGDNGSIFWTDDNCLRHNTHLHTLAGRNVLAWDGTGHCNEHNIVAQVGGSSQDIYGMSADPVADFSSFDFNHYYPAGQRIYDGKSLADLKAAGIDMQSTQSDDLGGIRAPDPGIWADPRDWDDAGFLAHFTPSADWDRAAGAETPGAFAPDGSFTVKAMPKIAGAGNSGCGWLGTPLVAKILNDHGLELCRP